MKSNIPYTIGILVIFFLSPVMGQENCPNLTQRAKFLSTELNKVTERIDNLNEEREMIEAEMANATSEQLVQLTIDRDTLISKINTQNNRRQELIESISDVGGRLRECE